MQDFGVEEVASVGAEPTSKKREREEEEPEETEKESSEKLVASRDHYARDQEQKGVLKFNVIWNNGEPEKMMQLVNLKNVFAAQLPEMPQEYIARLVLDRNHRSMAILKHGRVVGGICIRPFHTQAFAEIVFCAIMSAEQVKGYGTRVMNHLKEHVKTDGIDFFLTYADNYAIGYFQKQGFSKIVSMPKARWAGFIKDYDGGTLMECSINHKVDYLDITGMIKQQRSEVYKRIRQVSNSHAVFPGIKAFAEGATSVPIESIKGVLETGWKPEKELAAMHSEKSRGSEATDIRAKMGAVLKGLSGLKDSWPFLQPVNRDLVKDYYDVIKEPMDLKSMKDKLTDGDNCKQYNKATTTYYRCASSYEEQAKKLLKKMGIQPVSQKYRDLLEAESES
eukprot:g37509.t1